jgi:hypothetical protein
MLVPRLMVNPLALSATRVSPFSVEVHPARTTRIQSNDAFFISSALNGDMLW